jgi:hypothetical protein
MGTARVKICCHRARGEEEFDRTETSQDQIDGYSESEDLLSSCERGEKRFVHPQTSQDQIDGYSESEDLLSS